MLGVKQPFIILLSVDTEESHLTGIEVEVAEFGIGSSGMKLLLTFTVHDKLCYAALILVKVEEVRRIVILDKSYEAEILITFIVLKEADEGVFKGLKLDKIVRIIVKYGVYAVILAHVEG